MCDIIHIIDNIQSYMDSLPETQRCEYNTHYVSLRMTISGSITIVRMSKYNKCSLFVYILHK